jgi:hypothetical protein
MEQKMTTKADWEFRAEHLSDMADYLERKATAMNDEASRFRGLAEQARMLVRIGDHEGWRPIDTAPKGTPIQVWAADKEHHWLPFTACLEGGDRWTRPASRDGLPFAPTHWRELPTPPRASQS